MAKRKPGNNKRQPRMNGAGMNGRCISIMPDGSAEYFTPKPKPKQMQLRVQDGKAVVVKVERALL